MPNKCCITGCTSNYNNANTEHVSVFSFPRDVFKKQLWLRKIPRAFKPSRYSFVCAKHFDDRFIIRENCVTRDDGTELRVRRKNPALTDGAYPTKFQSSGKNYRHLPSYYRVAEMSSQQMQRKCKLGGMINRKRQCKREPIAISSYSQLLEVAESRLKSQKEHGWCWLANDDHMIITNIAFASGKPTINYTVQIDSNLSVKVILGNREASDVEMERLGWKKDRRVNSWTQIKQCMEKLKSQIELDVFAAEPDDQIETAIEILQNTLEVVRAGMHNTLKDDDAKRITFIIEQLQLLSKHYTHRKYSCELLIWCFALLLQSSAAYNTLKCSNALILPHERTLTRLGNPLKMTPGMSDSRFRRMKRLASSLLDNDRLVILQLDEIQVKPQYTFHGESLAGTAESSEAAYSIQGFHAFQISSVFSNYKDIALFLAVNQIDSDTLFVTTRDLILKLEQAGFKVLGAVVDNNLVNRNMFSKFSANSELNICVPHPADQTRPLFLIFNTGHIMKCIWNNWINQTDPNQTLIFPHPDPEQDGLICSAHFSVIRALYTLEQSKNMKYARRLTAETLNPSTFQRQNIATALNVFDESTSAALDLIGPKEATLLGWEGTSIFIKTVWAWWSMVNVKTPNNGIRKHNIWQEQVESMSDPRMKLFDDLFVWVSLWDDLPSQGTATKLTKETSTAFKHTLHALHELTSYVLAELGAKYRYVLMGKFQADNVEERFSLYRTMCMSRRLTRICKDLPEDKEEGPTHEYTVP